MTADLPLGEDFFVAFGEGMEIDGVAYRALSIERTGPASARIRLVEGKNREIRRVLERFGRRAMKLRRVRIGPLGIGDLAEGAFRELEPEEIRALRAYGRKEG